MPQARVLLDQLGVYIDFRAAGHLEALRTGMEAAAALLSTPDGSTAYDRRMRGRFAVYLVERQRLYDAETRWDTPFWARRREPAYQPR